MPNYPYRTLGIPLDLENWESLNRNFDDIESDLRAQDSKINSTAAVIREELAAQIVDSAKLIWQIPVDTFADLGTTYPDAEQGWTVMARDTGIVYRFDGFEWLEIQDIEPTAINALETQVNAIPLNQTKVEGQRNFHEFHQLHKYEGGDTQYSIKGERYFDFMIPLDTTDKMNIVFQKDTNDDFIKLRNFSVWGNLGGNSMLTYGSVSSGSMVTSGGANHYTSTNGTTITTSFTGTGIDLYHFFDTRGGLWRAEVDGAFVKNISTHINAVPSGEITNSTLSYAKRPIISGLSNATHELKLIYQGADPSNPATTDGSTPTTARGWIRYNTSPTEAAPTSFLVYATSFQLKETLLNNSSNKEFAFNVRPSGTSVQTQWFPEHNNLGTAFLGTAGYQKLYIDGIEVTSYAPTSYANFKSAKLIQVLDMKHPDDAQALARMTMVTTINRDGVHIDTTFDFLKDTLIAAGYVNMLPVEGAFARRLTTALGQNLTATATNDSFEDINEGDRSFSYMMTGAPASGDYYAGMIHRNVIETLRLGQAGRRNGDDMLGATWLQHRANGLQKLYPQVFADNYVMPIGSTYRFSGSFFAGKVQSARKLITGL